MIHINTYSKCTVSFDPSFYTITVRWKQSDVLKSEYKKIKVRSNILNIRMMICLRPFLTKLSFQWTNMASKTLIVGHGFYWDVRVFKCFMAKNYYKVTSIYWMYYLGFVFFRFLILLFDFLAWYFTRWLSAILSTDFVSRI